MKKTLFSSWVDAQILKKAEDLKKLYGLEKQSELIRFLIVKEHRERIKIPSLTQNENHVKNQTVIRARKRKIES